MYQQDTFHNKLFICSFCTAKTLNFHLKSSHNLVTSQSVPVPKKAVKIVLDLESSRKQSPRHNQHTTKCHEIDRT